MSKNVQQLFKLSSIIRGLSLKSSRSVFFRTYQTSCQHLTDREKHDAVQFYMSESSAPSTATKQTYKVSRMSNEYQNNFEVFNVIQTESNKINGPEAVRLLETLFKLNKNKEDKNSLRQKKEFSHLCELLKKNIRQLNENQTISALKYLNFFKIPTTTVIIQMLLQMIRESINKLSLEQIIFLNFLLSKCQKTPLVEALSIALPIVFDTHVTSQLDVDNIESLVSTLEYMRNLPAFSIKIPYVLKAIKKTDESKITAQLAVRLSFVLLELPLDKSAEPVVLKAFNALSKSIDVLSPMEVKALVHKTAMKQLDKVSNYSMFYNEKLMEQCAMYVVAKDMGFDVAIDILNNLSLFPHTNIPLLDYVASKCYDDIEILKRANHRQIQTLIIALSIADYKPVFWDTIKDHLSRDKLLIGSTSELSKLAINLAILDCYWPELLEKVFTNTYLAKRKERKRLLFLNSIVQKNCPDYGGPWPSEDVISSLRESVSYEKSDYPLKNALELATGGEQYISTNIDSKLGYFLDHAVIMRKGGFPMAINSTDEKLSGYIEDLPAIPDSQVILFLYIPEYGYVKNSERLTGFWSFLIRTIRERTNHTIIPVHSIIWRDLSETEQVRFISKALRLESNKLSAIINT